MALIGCGGRGRGVTAYVPQIGGAEVRGVSDVYLPRREQAAEQFGSTAKAFKDYRDVLASKDIDAVVLGTPDHWHAPMTIEAVAAGKDVYVEKPVTHDLSEGDKLVKAVEDSTQVVATGTQQRSWKHFLAAKQLIDEGVLGKITFVRCHWSQNYSRGGGASRARDVDLSQLDWDQWLGSAPKQPFDKVRFRFWRFFWDFGGGSFTDLMTHWIDVIQWYMKSPRPHEVHAAGTTYTQDWLEAPDTVTATMLFPEGYTAAYEGNMTFGLLGGGIVFRGDKAMMTLTRLGYDVYEEGAKPFEAVSLPEPIHHFARSEDTPTLEGSTARERSTTCGTGSSASATARLPTHTSEPVWKRPRRRTGPTRRCGRRRSSRCLKRPTARGASQLYIRFAARAPRYFESSVLVRPRIHNAAMKTRSSRLVFGAEMSPRPAPRHAESVRHVGGVGHRGESP